MEPGFAVMRKCLLGAFWTSRGLCVCRAHRGHSCSLGIYPSSNCRDNLRKNKRVLGRRIDLSVLVFLFSCECSVGECRAGNVILLSLFSYRNFTLDLRPEFHELCVNHNLVIGFTNYFFLRVLSLQPQIIKMYGLNPTQLFLYTIYYYIKNLKKP